MLCTVPAEIQLGCVLNSTVIPEARASFCGGRPCPDKGKATVMSNANGESDVTPTESETTCTVGNLSRGSRETPAISVSSMEADRSEKARGHNSDMHVAGESDSPVVPEKSANKSDVPSLAESMEERGLTNATTRLVVSLDASGCRT